MYEDRFAELVEHFGRAADAAHELTEQFLAGFAPSAEPIAQVRLAADAFDQLAGDLSADLDGDLDAADVAHLRRESVRRFAIA